jgi:hypothetical protein
MARTNVAVSHSQDGSVLDGLATATALDAAAGAMFTNNGATRVIVYNTGAGAHVVTFVTPRTINPGALAVADPSITLAAGKHGIFGPLDPTTFNQPSGADTGKVYVNSDGTESEVKILPFID